jgi:SAM-dependent methyltransferase
MRKSLMFCPMSRDTLSGGPKNGGGSGPRSRRFDVQAGVYDRRTGMGEAAARLAAMGIIEAGHCAGGRLIEIGAGTGELGRHLAALPCGYLGLDFSRPMLGFFRARRREFEVPANLLQADCDRSWPLRDDVADAVVASRVAHLLDAERFAHECRRVLRAGGRLLLGRVEHAKGGLRQRLRLMRRRLYAERGLHQGAGEDGQWAAVGRCLGLNAELLGTHHVAAWVRSISAREVIDAWVAVEPRGDRPAGAAMRRDVQAALRIWAKREFGALTYSETCEERYCLTVVRFP